MRLYYILDANGDPLPCDDVLAWGWWFKTADRRVSEDLDEGHDGEPATRVRVSTVFLGLDHNFSDKGPPVLWETMVFGGVLDGECQRYTSKEAALLGHQAMCARVRETITK